VGVEDDARGGGNNNTSSLLVTAAMLFSFVLFLWAFAVLVWDFLEERTRGWLRVLLETCTPGW
jgi:hypothetical protein